MGCDEFVAGDIDGRAAGFGFWVIDGRGGGNGGGKGFYEVYALGPRTWTGGAMVFETGFEL